MGSNRRDFLKKAALSSGLLATSFTGCTTSSGHPNVHRGSLAAGGDL
ncbi:twin-arginine translocation signal domain-containing protein [Geofilum rubicundum]|nr:twin-arginine translocation signal domain-containing protein [Geofilum rubicundum]